MFDVTWHGRVAVDNMFTVVNGTSVSITGVAGSLGSSQLSSDERYADDSTGTAAIEGSPFKPLFSVSFGATLTLDNLVLQAYDMRGSMRYGGAIYARTFHNKTSETFDGLSLATVNIIDCTFRNYTVSARGKLAGSYVD